MGTIERIKQICKDRGIPISRLEKDCGFANAYLVRLKKDAIPADRLKKIAEVLNVSEYHLMTGNDENQQKAMTMLNHAVAQAGSASPFVSNHGQMTWIDDDELYMIETVHNWSEAQKKKLRKYIETINEYIGDQT
nr:MAG TPA: repressor protein [Bacteriophage sp.]